MILVFMICIVLGFLILNNGWEHSSYSEIFMGSMIILFSVGLMTIIWDVKL